jgi:hypothetical protein
MAVPFILLVTIFLAKSCNSQQKVVLKPYPAKAQEQMFSRIDKLVAEKLPLLDQHKQPVPEGYSLSQNWIVWAAGVHRFYIDGINSAQYIDGYDRPPYLPYDGSSGSMWMKSVDLLSDADLLIIAQLSFKGMVYLSEFGVYEGGLGFNHTEYRIYLWFIDIATGEIIGHKVLNDEPIKESMRLPYSEYEALKKSGSSKVATSDAQRVLKNIFVFQDNGGRIYLAY